MDERILEYFQKLIYQETGIVYNDKNSFAPESRLQKVAKSLEFESVEKLYESCRTSIGNDVKSFILDIATNNETSFFRDAHVFQAVMDTVIAPLFEAGKKHFELWSAACSSGQEVYTMAFLLDEFKQKNPSMSYHIVGSDISKEILAKSIAGEYSQLEVQRGLPTKYLVKYFEKDPKAKPGQPGLWRIKDNLRSQISFRNLNLLKPFPVMGPFDVVFLRNVLIYHDDEHRTDILDRIHKKLHTDGKLFLGSAERVVGLDHLYEIGVVNRAVSYSALKRPKAA